MVNYDSSRSFLHVCDRFDVDGLSSVAMLLIAADRSAGRISNEELCCFGRNHLGAIFLTSIPTVRVSDGIHHPTPKQFLYIHHVCQTLSFEIN